ncbi:MULTISPECIES: DUF2185 domain-containing protein [Listeria]|uniref:immunity protein Imm33 domain-containing protein n=1 Tax=Listeria TaxID=1637 RepID=UPI000B590697|nr:MULTISPECIES: DUF2185 domain-containing protein [Listeria]
MRINNSDFGGFIVSNNICKGNPIKYSFREKSENNNLNGWMLYSELDDEEYVNDSSNFTILNADSIFKIAPVMLEIFSAPYGADLCWLYEKDVHIGFYDLKTDREITIDEIITTK